MSVFFVRFSFHMCQSVKFFLCLWYFVFFLAIYLLNRFLFQLSLFDQCQFLFSYVSVCQYPLCLCSPSWYFVFFLVCLFLISISLPIVTARSMSVCWFSVRFYSGTIYALSSVVIGLFNAFMFPFVLFYVTYLCISIYIQSRVLIYSCFPSYPVTYV